MRTDPAAPSTDAINTPVKRSYTRQTHSDELPTRPVEAIETGSIADLAADIITSTEDLAAKDYLAELAFMEDKLTIRMHRGREKFSPQFVDFTVEGKTAWVQVETDTLLARKYVEVMARSQPMDIRTTSHKIEDSPDAQTVNKINRSTYSQFSFSVLHDPSAKGGAWLAKVMREA